MNKRGDDMFSGPGNVSCLGLGAGLKAVIIHKNVLSSTVLKVVSFTV